MLDDIRNKIYRTVFNQCLKMLHPSSDAYEYWKTRDIDANDQIIELTDEETSVLQALENNELETLIAMSDDLGMDGRLVRDIRSGSPDLANINPNDNLPILFLEIGTGGFDFDEERIEARMRGELFHVIIRCVVGKPDHFDGPVWAETAPVQLLKIRAQLEYLLDISVFRGIQATRIGYELPSIVYSCGIVSMESLEGMPAGFDCQDWRFVVEFHKMSERIN